MKAPPRDAVTIVYILGCKRSLSARRRLLSVLSDTPELRDAHASFCVHRSANVKSTPAGKCVIGGGMGQSQQHVLVNINQRRGNRVMTS
jgi:hypothetical protein